MENLKTAGINCWVGFANVNQNIRDNIDALESARKILIECGKKQIVLGWNYCGNNSLGFFWQNNQHDPETYENFTHVVYLKDTTSVNEILSTN